MKTVSLIFPHQLYEKNPCISKGRKVFLVEEWLYFSQYSFHKQKLILHRASMKYYENRIRKYGEVEYITASDPRSDTSYLITSLAKEGVEEIHYTDTVDNWLEKRISATVTEHSIKLVKYPSPNFLNKMEEVEEFFREKKKYFQTDFYIWQRKKRRLLLENGHLPMGGKWSYDAENRKRFPRNGTLPEISWPAENQYVAEAVDYVQKNFADNYGSGKDFRYPVTHDEAQQWLQQFLRNRFHSFGVYEDAMLQRDPILFHSVLTPMLNIGLLQPADIVEQALQTAIEREIPLNSLEGFIRQIIGWREFIRIVYEREGSKQRTTNYWNFTRPIPASFWKGTTGIHPVDAVIREILKTGYCHHIERLMVLGNFMILCEFDPNEVYRWFMEMFVDSYDWVMVPNVYGMTQFADGGLMTTKPYISGSNYLLKMGDWEKGDWQLAWDGLFWRFMHVHRDFFQKNPRLGMLLNQFDKSPKEKQAAHLLQAENYLAAL